MKTHHLLTYESCKRVCREKMQCLQNNMHVNFCIVKMYYSTLRYMDTYKEGAPGVLTFVSQLRILEFNSQAGKLPDNFPMLWCPYSSISMLAYKMRSRTYLFFHRIGEHLGESTVVSSAGNAAIQS